MVEVFVEFLVKKIELDLVLHKSYAKEAGTEAWKIREEDEVEFLRKQLSKLKPKVAKRLTYANEGTGAW